MIAQPLLTACQPARSSFCRVAVLLSGILATLFTASASAEPQADGLVVLKSTHDVQTTMDRLEAVVREKGMNVFARIDHAGGAESVDMNLSPTQVLVFGNPRVGTPLMTCSHTIAIDLPQKMLVWEDVAGSVWLGYNDPAYLKARHASDGCDEVFGKVTGALSAFAKAATGGE